MNIDGSFKGEPIVLNTEIQPEEYIDLTVKLKAPERGGRHVSVWRMVDEKGERFGHRFQAEVFVRD